MDAPLSSFGFNADTQFDIKKGTQYSDKVSVGLLLLNDRSRVNDFNTNHIDLNGAFHKLLDKQTNQVLSLGVSLGISQFGFNYNDVTFGDQYNGVDGYSNPTSELFPPNSLAVGDLGVGLSYSANVKSNTRLQLGFAAFHINQPNRSFFNQLENINVSFDTEDAFPMRLTGIVTATIQSSKTTTFIPRLAWFKQSTVQEFNAGATYRQLFYTTKHTALHLGLYASIADHIESTHFNSVTGLIGFELENLMIGFSYEQAMDDLARHSGFGSFELSMTYIGSFEDDGDFCPTF